MPLPRPGTLSALVLALALPACWVSPPRTEDWLAVGFRSPEQAFQTFQTAVRADSAELEFRCFSDGFRALNRISKLTWAIVRAELRDRYPWIRKGIVDAAISATVVRAHDRVVLHVTSHGETLAIGLVREDVAELWAGPEPLVDEYVPFGEHAGTQTGADGRKWFYATVALPPGDERASDVTELHVGREWKIDSIESVEPPTHAPSSRAKARARARFD